MSHELASRDVGFNNAGKATTLVSAAAVMVVLGFICARFLKQRRPADADRGLKSRLSDP
ncbi:hypothetical protein [Bradyrhizobium sp. CER78]|uniref:hypothetical protein n=1 Tax=Bradyrhizobium sp. CER78 TaxID=3039162 RepID=UPI002449F4A9|nr:hypothetical protein [Bradyrhizobium sp. CER78]MDH2381616.1 hypothetical protein [Bradyrhizobium sp. CER78]